MGFYRYVTTIDGIRITGYFSNTDMKLIRAVVGDANIAPLMGAAVVERLEIEAQACRDAAAEIKAWRGLDACHLEEVAA